MKIVSLPDIPLSTELNCNRWTESRVLYVISTQMQQCEISFKIVKLKNKIILSKRKQSNVIHTDLARQP